MFKADLAAAGVAAVIDSSDGPEVRDMHALRNTYISNLIRTGADLKQVMTLARHSDPKLTAGSYARTRLYDLGAVVNKLPTSTPSTPSPVVQRVVLARTGTDHVGSSEGAVASDGRGGFLRMFDESATDDAEVVAIQKPLEKPEFEDTRGLLTTCDESAPGANRTRDPQFRKPQFYHESPTASIRKYFVFMGLGRRVLDTFQPC